MLHRRSRSSVDTIQKNSQAKRHDERSTMSLCSVTSDEYDLDDTMTDSFDEYDDVVSTRDGRGIMIHPSSSQPTFPIFTRGNNPSMVITQESMAITPPTPTRLTLKMRPSVSFPLPFLENSLYTEYEESDDGSHDAYVHAIDEMSREGDYTNVDFSAQPNDIIPKTITTTENSIANGTIISASASFDENNENENMVPSPTTPPPSHHYQNNSAVAHPRRLSPPPMIRLRQKRIIYLPFHSHNNYIHDDDHQNSITIDNDDDVHFTMSSFNNNNMHHLLLPDDF